tara:strand:+ start:1549 stop:4290 length:2742 start_codon:yes stop_codon:yes gene_type:complete
MRYLSLLLLLASITFSQNKQKDPNTGEISEYSSNGNILERYTVDSNGKYHGKRERWYETRNYYDEPIKYSIENWKHGRKYGKQTYWHKNGQLDMIIYKDDDALGETYGEFVRYYENGQKRFYQLRDRKGRLIGADKKWNEDGFLLEHFNYKDGNKHGDQKEWEFEPGFYDDEPGKSILIKHLKYENGKKHGEQKYFSSEYAGSLSKLENYKNGDKHGVFQEIDRYGNINYQESWYEGRKHGKWFMHGYEGEGPEYEHNYRFGKKNGVWIEYQSVPVSEGDESYLEFIGIKKIQTWKDGKLNGVTRQWGDNCFKGENKVMYPEIPAYNLILEENYKNGKKEGVEKRWNSGYYEINSDGDNVWVDGQLTSEQTYKEGKLSGPYRFLYENGAYEEGIYANYERKPKKKRRYNGWYSINYDGLYLDYEKFQQENRLEYLDSVISKLENMKKYESAKNNLLEKQTINNSIIKENLTQIGLLINKKDSLEKFLNYFKNEKTGANKLQKILEKKNANKKLNKKEIKILDQIKILNNNILSTSLEIQDIKNNSSDLNIKIQNDSVLINYYNSFLSDNKISNYLEAYSSKKELELSKIIYDTSIVYSKDYYTHKRVKKFDDDDDYGLNITLLVSKNNIGPFYLGMSEDEIYSFLNSDEYFFLFNSKYLHKPNDFAPCIVPCDTDINEILFKENLTFDEWFQRAQWSEDYRYFSEDSIAEKEAYFKDIYKEESPVSTSPIKWDSNMVKYKDGDKIISLQYEIVGSKRLDKKEDDPEPNWYDLQINFFLTNDTVHTISLKKRRGDNDHTYRDILYSTNNGIYFLKPFDTFSTKQLNSYDFSHMFKIDKSEMKYENFIYAHNSDVSLFLENDYIDEKTTSLHVVGFKITSNSELQNKGKKINMNEITSILEKTLEEITEIEDNGY